MDAISILYKDTEAQVITPDGDTEFFEILAGVLQGDTLAPFLFIIVLHYPFEKLLKKQYEKDMKGSGSRSWIDLSLLFSFFSIETLSITGQKISKSLKNGSDRLRKGQLHREHPRRPRGSQSGREKRQDESFQVWKKETLGTDSHRTISRNSSRCRFLIGHKKINALYYCAQSANSSS